MENLLLVLYEEEEELQREATQNLVLNEESVKLWPPWPWPPWGGDDDKPDGDKDPKDHKEVIHKLAKRVVKLERRLANASLDLYVIFTPSRWDGIHSSPPAISYFKTR